MTKRQLLVSVTAVRLWINIMIYRNIPLSDPYAFQNVELLLYLRLSSESSLDEYHWTINVHLVVRPMVSCLTFANYWNLVEK